MGTALMAVPSCTDTWNEHYQTEDAYTATESLWELLEAREDLSNFRSIVAKAKFYRDETHPAYTVNGKDTVYYTFKDVLNANSPVTVWAPTNDALTAEEWQKFEEMAENDGYNLQQQFVGNHIALYRKTMAKSGKETLRLINSKFAVINYDEGTLQKAQVVEKNIGARNGLLHVMDAQNEFLFNLYEYIKFSGEVETFRNYLVQRDTVYFLESASIEGLPDENGNPTYVDSVYFQDNMLFNNQFYNPTGADAEDAWMNSIKMFRAQINTEDSAFVMVVPTDQAWQNATEMLKPLYNYVSTYPRMDKVNLTATKGETMDIFGARKTFATGKGYETVDSLQDVNINMDIISPLVFNVNLQPQVNGQIWTAEKFINGGYKDCEYLLTTVGDTIRDIYEMQDGVKTLVWSKNSLFEGEGVKETKEMSNGYAIITDKWNYARDYWMPNIDFDASVFTIYDKATSTRPSEYDINNTTAADWIDKYGRCSQQRYLHVNASSTSTNPEVAFGLTGNKDMAYGSNAGVMSGKYDIQIVMVPRWYETSYETPDTADAALKNRVVCTLYYWDESLIGKSDLKYTKQIKLTSAPVEYSGEKVDTLTVFTDVEFPVSYKNLSKAYPVLHIKSDLKSADVNKNGYSRAFNIDRIILKSKQAE